MSRAARVRPPARRAPHGRSRPESFATWLGQRVEGPLGRRQEQGAPPPGGGPSRPARSSDDLPVPGGPDDADGRAAARSDRGSSRSTRSSRPGTSSARSGSNSGRAPDTGTAPRRPRRGARGGGGRVERLPIPAVHRARHSSASPPHAAGVGERHLQRGQPVALHGVGERARREVGPPRELAVAQGRRRSSRSRRSCHASRCAGPAEGSSGFSGRPTPTSAYWAATLAARSWRASARAPVGSGQEKYPVAAMRSRSGGSLVEDGPALRYRQGPHPGVDQSVSVGRRRPAGPHHSQGEPDAGA